MASSATQPLREQAKRNGTNTAEYKKVKENMGNFITAIESIPRAVKSLTTKFQEAKWLGHSAGEISADQLITQALDRIKIDAAEHRAFLDMLKSIEGTDLITQMLDGVYYKAK